MGRIVKPPVLREGSLISVVSPASPAEAGSLARGMQEIAGLGFQVRPPVQDAPPDGYFAAPLEHRRLELEVAMLDREISAVFCARGGYGSN